MRAQNLFAVVVWSALGAVGAGCQTYDFQPMSPLTVVQSKKVVTIDPIRLKPNLWLLVDQSGSMGSGPGSRMAALQSAMNTFLTSKGAVARMALSLFPVAGGEQCAETNSVAVPLPDPTTVDTGTDATLQATATAINGVIQNAHGWGGTPTAASIAFVGNQGGLQQDDHRDDFILLLADGSPNCNSQNPDNKCQGAGAGSGLCSCTTTTCDTATNCSIGCLDATNTAAVIGQQKTKGIRTIILSFGGDANTAALTAMATAGGAGFRKCPNGNECDSGDTCTAGLCGRQYFTANNATDLANALQAISESVVGADACTFQLADQPTSDQYIAVIVNGQDVPSAANTWTYTGGAVKFDTNSVYCQAILNRTTGYNIEIRYVQTL